MSRLASIAVQHSDPCPESGNVLKDPIMDADASVTYDVVSSTFCLEEACKSQDDLQAAVKRISGILKPNGHLIMAMLMEESSCKLDDGVITCLPITDDQLKGALKEAGFGIEEIYTYYARSIRASRS